MDWLKVIGLWPCKSDAPQGMDEKVAAAERWVTNFRSDYPQLPEKCYTSLKSVHILFDGCLAYTTDEWGEQLLILDTAHDFRVVGCIRLGAENSFTLTRRTAEGVVLCSSDELP
jgi:hypothetical protein